MVQTILEAEFIAANEASRGVTWLEKLWKEIKSSKPNTYAMCDRACL
jgi:hypothetical protein